MTEIAFTILEISAISVPLIAILVIQIFRTEKLNEVALDEELEYLSRLLILTAISFLLAVAIAILLGLRADLSVMESLGITALGIGIYLLTLTVLLFPILASQNFAKETEQQTLTETGENVEEHLPPQAGEDTSEEANGSEFETEK